MGNRKYTLKDWFEGIIYLETCPIVYTPNKDYPIKATLDNFSEKDVNKIKSKQKELFEGNCETLLKKFQGAFIKRYNLSEVQDFLYDNEIADINNILFLAPMQILTDFRNRDMIIEESDLYDMRRFYQVFFERGEKYYCFMHSPHYPYQDKTKIPSEVYAAVCWNYLKWLTHEVPSLVNRSSDSKVEKIAVPIIALIHLYNGIPISRDNCNEKAADYGYKKTSSGEGKKAILYLLAINSEDITILFDSSVGSSNYLRTLCEMIQDSKVKITGRIIGKASGAGAVLLQACHEREMLGNATINPHLAIGIPNIEIDSETDLAFLEDKIKRLKGEMVDIQKIYDKLFSIRMNKSLEEVRKIMIKNVIYNAPAALELGLVDRIV